MNEKTTNEKEKRYAELCEKIDKYKNKMTDKELNAAIREACKLKGINPDEKIEFHY